MCLPYVETRSAKAAPIAGPGKHLRHRVGGERDAGPDDGRQREEEDQPRGSEQEQPRDGGVAGDGAVGACLPEEGDGGDGGARQAHREREQEQVPRGAGEGEGDE